MHGGSSTNEAEATTEARLDGEFLAIAERVIVAPVPGRFVPAVMAGSHVVEGEAVGAVVRSGTETQVHSTFAGRFMGHLADAGERVRDGQPLAWIRLAG